MPETLTKAVFALAAERASKIQEQGCSLFALWWSDVTSLRPNSRGSMRPLSFSFPEHWKFAAWLKDNFPGDYERMKRNGEIRE